MSGQQTTTKIIAEGKQFALLAAEGGAAFILRSNADFYTAYLGGEDATRFCEDYERIQSQFPSWQPDQAQSQLWDQGGYSWLAAQEAD